MLKDFNTFLFESRGFSETVAEYAKETKRRILEEVKRYLAKSNTAKNRNIERLIIFDEANLTVSPEASREFPIDKIKIELSITPVPLEEFTPYSASYLRNYDKVKMSRGVDERLDITVFCKFYVIQGEFGLDLKMTNKYLDDILHHELTHAFNDYKEPNFLKNYRLGVMSDYASASYKFIKESQYLGMFFQLLYTLTDNEIKAIVGERRSFRSIKEFNEYGGTIWARRGMEFSADEYYEGVESELGESKHWDEIDRTFGKIFVELYLESAGEEANIDPKILKLEESKNLLEVLKHFEPHLNRKGRELFVKLSKKIIAQGRGKFI